MSNHIPSSCSPTLNVGSAVFPLLALLNHSCDQNVTKYNLGSSVVAVAARDIKRGEEVSENYFPHHAYIPR